VPVVVFNDPHNCWFQEDPDNPAPTLGEIIFTVFDWQTTNRGSVQSAKDIWDFTRSLFPPDNDMGMFNEAMTILRRHRLETLKTIPVCVNMCVAYWDPTHPKLQGREYKNAHRTRCPYCNQNRYLSDRKTERRRIYYFPYKEWLQDIFTKPDLSRTMDNDFLVTDYPSGHLRRSEGWRKKVHRHIAHVSCTISRIVH
jgi:hypothetical protein